MNIQISTDYMLSKYEKVQEIYNQMLTNSQDIY